MNDISVTAEERKRIDSFRIRMDNAVDDMLFGDAWNNEQFGGYTNGNDKFSKILDTFKYAMDRSLPISLSHEDMRQVLIALSVLTSEAEMSRLSAKGYMNRYRKLSLKNAQLSLNHRALLREQKSIEGVVELFANATKRMGEDEVRGVIYGMLEAYGMPGYGGCALCRS